MTGSWYVLRSDVYVSCTSTSLKRRDNVSFYEKVYFDGPLGPIVLYNYVSAEGRIDKSKDGYTIRAIGKYEDVLVVVQRLEKYFEPVDLNNPFNFPSLPNWIDRLKYLIHGIPSQKNK